MAKLQASERAKVEAMHTDGIVRIISDTFKQLSFAGWRQAYNDGRRNDRLDATSYPHEAAGVEEDKSPKGTSKSGVVEPDPRFAYEPLTRDCVGGMHAGGNTFYDVSRIVFGRLPLARLVQKAHSNL